MEEQIQLLTTSLNSANAEISELRKTETRPVSECSVHEPSNSADLAFSSMDLPTVVQEKLIELHDENNQLKVEVQRLSVRLSSRDEILNELEEENLQLRNSMKQGHTVDPQLVALQQKITLLESTIEQKNASCNRMEEQIELLTTSLNSANAEISELRKAEIRPVSECSIHEPSNSADLEKLQEERDDAVFELQRATHRIAALEEERNDYAERAEAASSEARDMARHNKELREQLHELEAELVASRTNSNIANRGNSMFAEFAEERVRLESDLKLLYCKYSALRKENCQLANELDEARLLALRRGRREGTQKCRCQQLSAELVELRGRVRTLDDRLASAKRDLMDRSIEKSGIDALLKCSYKSLKLEMESLRQERDKLRVERDKFFDENASLAARAANAETLMGYANDDIETLKIQLAMFREREQKKDAEKVSSLINGGSGDIEAECPIIPPPKLTATPIEKQAQTPAGRQSSREEPFTPFATSKTPVCATGEPSFYQDEHSSFGNLSYTVAEPMSEVRPKKIRFLDVEQNDDEDVLRRNSISASELRRLQRKQARKGKSKVLPVYDPSDKITVKLPQPSVASLSRDENPGCSGNLELPCSSLEKRLPLSTEVELPDATISSVTSSTTSRCEPLLPLSDISSSESRMEVQYARRYSNLDTTRDFNKTTLEDVIEEKENDSSCKYSEETF